MAVKIHKARVREMQQGRRKNPIIAALSFMAYLNFNLMRYLVKTVSSRPARPGRCWRSPYPGRAISSPI